MRTGLTALAALAILALTASTAAASGVFSVGIDGGPGRISGDGSIDCVRDAGAPGPTGRCSAFFPDEIICQPICIPFPPDVRMTAASLPGTGFGFDRWIGACAGSGPTCTTLVTHSQTTTAVFRDTEAPSVTVAPTVSGTYRVRAASEDNVGVVRVEFRVRGVLRRIDIAAPYTWSLDTTGIADGPAEITATSFDEAGNSRVSSTSIVVDN
jgi:hypothetical protein